MSEQSVTLDRASDDDLAYVESLLERSGLPTADLDAAGARFYVAHDATDRVGVGGLEVLGTDGLLRSVAVEPEYRGEGYGAAVVDALETEARRAGVDRLTLLTTTATDFFAGLGYEAIDRDEAPEPVRSTTEFDELCPASATVMRKSLR